ncbi:MAG: hypothetical protein KDE25_00325 [Novosphingobium sp.]|nr:hypothetical protein [Novosphingobium sp.]
MWDDAASDIDEPFYLTRWIGPKLAIAIVMSVLYLSIRYQLEVHSDVTTNVFGLAHMKANLFLFLGASGDAQWVFSGGGESFLVRQDVVATAAPYAASWRHMLDRIVRGTWIAVGLLFAPPAFWHSLPVVEDALARIKVQRAKWCERHEPPEVEQPESPKAATSRRRPKPKPSADEQLSLPFDRPEKVPSTVSDEAIKEKWNCIARHTEENPVRPAEPAREPLPTMPPPVAIEEPKFVPGQLRRKSRTEDQ